MRYIVLATALILSACGTIQEQKLEYCDTETKTFIGIPYNRTSDCKGVNSTDSGSGVSLARPEQPLP